MKGLPVLIMAPVTRVVISGVFSKPDSRRSHGRGRCRAVHSLLLPDLHVPDIEHAIVRGVKDLPIQDDLHGRLHFHPGHTTGNKEQNLQKG